MTGRCTLILAALAAFSIVCGGCSSSTTGPDPIVEDPYPSRTSPAGVVEKLRAAYINMDADAYLDCLAEDFILFLNPSDTVQDPSLLPHWGKPTEAAVHEAMFSGESGVRVVALDFVSAISSWEPNDPSHHMDDEWVRVEDVDLRIELPDDLTMRAAAPIELWLRIDRDQVGANGEILWEISRWYDASEGGCGSCSGCYEAASWGSLKAIFLDEG
jgi:hypothetical protein